LRRVIRRYDTPELMRRAGNATSSLGFIVISLIALRGFLHLDVAVVVA
jgi:hypothetical protein